MSVVEHLMGKNVKNLPSNFTEEIMGALYDKYAREVQEKAKEMSDKIVKQARDTVDQLEREKALFKEKSKRIETEFEKLVKHLEGQGWDVDWDKKQSEAPVVKSLQENEEYEQRVSSPEPEGKGWQLQFALV